MPSTFTTANLLAVSPKLPATRAALLAPHLGPALERFAITDPREVAFFLAQTAHETVGWVRDRENMTYRAERLPQVFKLFRQRPELIDRYAGQPVALANRVYADRNGNGPERSGDGWRFRGGGSPMLTGRKNYRDCGQAIGEPLDLSPGLITRPDVFWLAGAWFWSVNCQEDAQLGNYDSVSRRINPGESKAGLEHRRRFLPAALQVVGAKEW